MIVGPASFLEEKKFAVALGDRLTVTGAPLPNRPEVIVFKVGEITLVLRDKQGRPEWAGA